MPAGTVGIAVADQSGSTADRPCSEFGMPPDFEDSAHSSGIVGTGMGHTGFGKADTVGHIVDSFVRWKHNFGRLRCFGIEVDSVVAVAERMSDIVGIPGRLRLLVLLHSRLKIRLNTELGTKGTAGYTVDSFVHWRHNFGTLRHSGIEVDFVVVVVARIVGKILSHVCLSEIVRMRNTGWHTVHIVVVEAVDIVRNWRIAPERIVDTTGCSGI